ncbi:MAG: periplasmic repressor CpxP [Armatimonadetes bacterium]|nr:periplasmic repressor CpxP [Armatimonadota bacterium]
MKLIKVCTLGVALSLVAGAGWAQGQGGGRPGGGRPGFGGPGGFGFGGPGGGGGIGTLLMIPEVQTELKLDDAQKDLLQQINQESFQKMRTLFPRPEPGAAPAQINREEMTKKFTALRVDQEKKIGEVLDPKQMTRLKQLGIQREGTRALARPEVGDQLKLTPDQRTKISAAIEGEREAMGSIFPRPAEGQPFQPPTEEQRAQIGQKMRDLRTATDAKVLGVLTEPQKKQFQTLQGAPFKFPEFRGFGGPGGGRRPGGNN